MIAKKCDRCGMLYEQYNIKNNEKQINGITTLNINKEQEYCMHGPFDLCPKCSSELVEWMYSSSKLNLEDGILGYLFTEKGCYKVKEKENDNN